MSELVDPIGPRSDAEIDAYVAMYVDVPDPEPWQLNDSQLHNRLRIAQRHLASQQARYLALLAEAEAREVTLRSASLPTASWLVDNNTHSARAARAEVRLATRLAQHPIVADGISTGRLSVEQAGTIVHGLSRLPDSLTREQVEAVASDLVELGEQFGPYGLARLVNHAVEAVAPEVADEADRTALERAEARAQRDRYLTWREDEDGNWLLRAKLTRLAGAQLTETLTAIATSQRKADALAGVETSRAQAAADALLVLVGHYASCGQAPRHGADRPRVIVTLDYHTLRDGLGQATLLNTDTRITAGQARRLACDAGIIPQVLGAESVRLDVGRERRLFTGALRTVLIARDGGCAFPQCDRPPADCEGHHITPWWDGGRTTLDNAVLLCEHHHHLIEPDPAKPPDQNWAVRLGTDGTPTFSPPLRPGHPDRHWRRHPRFLT